MPCWTITQVKLELLNANLDLLKKALESMGHTVYQNGNNLYWQDGMYDKTKDQLVLGNGSEREGNRIKQAYSTEILKSNARKFGWRLKFKGNNHWQVIKN